MRGVDAGFDKQTADTSADDFLFDELQAPVRLPRQSVGTEDKQDLDGFPSEKLLEAV
jgi:hypothetical protein